MKKRFGVDRKLEKELYGEIKCFYIKILRKLQYIGSSKPTGIYRRSFERSRVIERIRTAGQNPDNDDYRKMLER
jgi:hypothetical protein